LLWSTDEAPGREDRRAGERETLACDRKNRQGFTHPMEENHYIEWIEVIADGSVYKKFLSPGDSPEADFVITPEKVKAREYCSIHGLWKS